MKTAPRALVARADGSVIDLPEYSAAVDAGQLRPAAAADFIPLPEGSLLLALPERTPVAYDGREPTPLAERSVGPVNAVAAALPLGYTRTLLPAYEERTAAPALPLYGFAAVAWSRGVISVAAVRTDALESWSAASRSPEVVRKAIERRLKEFGRSRLIRQLARCAVEYGCYTAQNVFLGRGEAALPVSPACNAECVGCISLQRPDAGVLSPQQRIQFLPEVQEIAAVAVAHLSSADGAIVSFGQGCEGEPLLAAVRIGEAIREIRRRTPRGTIHCNTNASRPAALGELIDAGLQSIRVSLNSARPAVYAAYYRPAGYHFEDVRASLRLAAERSVSVSLNLLTHPGVTDDPEEMEAFAGLLRSLDRVMVQTRTLNIDPARYFATVGRPRQVPIGMRAWIQWLRKEFPRVTVGNFTRPV